MSDGFGRKNVFFWVVLQLAHEFPVNKNEQLLMDLLIIGSNWRHRPTNKPISHTRQPPTNVNPWVTDQTGTGKSTVFFSTRDGSDQAFCLLAEHGNLL